ncbi:MAG TPA: ATP-binding protein [Thermoanaerobaculia bacterium]|nr:ATP-binding protein [Thermoanaerobaculia bacterium]
MDEERILILAPTGRDAALACQMLDRQGFAPIACADQEELCREIEAGAGLVVVTEEALQPWTINGLLEVLGQQEPWSDLPLIVFSRNGDSSADVLAALGPLSNATILERPVRIDTLTSAVQAALRARRRQYQVRDLLRRQAEADRRKDEFLAMLGHELRNPLAAIRNALWVLGKVGSPDPRAVKQREVIERQSSHLVRMVDDLLDVSRVTRGKILLKHQAVDLEEVVSRCLQELGTALLAENHGLHLTVRTEPAIVEGDPVRLEQVVCNLIQNAIKYTPRGGTLSIVAGVEGDEAVVRVRDTGIGLVKEMLPRIFEPFTQVESSRSRSEGGLGLGLPLVHSLIGMHGGQVEALSDGPGKGSEFVVRLPLRKAATAAKVLLHPKAVTPASPALPQAPASTLHILVIEDNVDGRESMRELLEIWGHRVDLAESGPEGVEKALATQPDLALIDIGLPGFDGNEVARRIRSVYEGDQITLIAMTGYGQPEDRRRALQAGFDAYLVKPVDPAELSRLLTAVGNRDPAALVAADACALPPVPSPATRARPPRERGATALPEKGYRL